MKIDRGKGKKCSTDAPAEAKALIARLKECQSKDDLLNVIKSIKTWTFGKCELYHWVDVLDRFDGILEEAARKTDPGSWIIACDQEGNTHLKECALHVLRFTTMLVEHSFSRHLYNSIEHLIDMLVSVDLEVVLEVLHLLYMFSKRSNYLTRMSGMLRTSLNQRLTYLAESWGGKEAGFGLADCCQDYTLSSYPSSATSVHLEYTNLQAKPTRGKADAPAILHLVNLHTVGKNAGKLMDEITVEHSIPTSKTMLLFTHLRLATNFAVRNTRILCVQARLQALSVLIYANGISDNIYQLLYRGFMEELVDVLELEDPRLTEIKAAALRTLTSIIHLDRAQHFPKIIDVTEVGSYHGFLPMMVRSCIAALTSPNGKSSENFPLPLATALFSFVYHLASYEQGAEALVTCGMLESLIKVINWNTIDAEQITFVTRAVRVIDLITNMDMHAFQSHNGLTNFINRLEMEVNECRKDQPFEIHHEEVHMVQEEEAATGQESDAPKLSDSNSSPMDTDSNNEKSDESTTGASTSEASKYLLPATEFENKGLTCLPQRAALLKSMLNFLKKAIQDVAFADSIRHIMETSLPSSLKHIISNAEYYGSSLFLLATDVVTVYVFQEPSLLSSLQDSGLTEVMLDAILTKDLPATREVISSIPNVFSALSLNTRGLNSFVKRRPFHRIFRVLITPEYLPPMRRRRTAESLGDTASNLGAAMDELMRHQPSLKTEAIKALVELLQELCSMGRDAKYSCWKPQSKVVVTVMNNNTRAGTSEGGSSDDDDEEDEEGVIGMAERISQTNTRNNREDTAQPGSETTVPSEEKTAVPLVDYILNVMKFVEAILSNNSTDDHCREFVNQKGLEPLLEVFSIPNLPLDFPTSPACQAATSVCKSILNLAHEGRVLSEGMTGLENLLKRLKPLNQPLEEPGSSVLLHELACAGIPPELVGNPQDTPILNAMTATHAHIMMFIHLCRTGQNDIRSMSISNWGSQGGLKILKELSELYWNLIWESSVLLAICGGDYEPGPNEFARADLDKMFPPESKTALEVSLKDAVEVPNFDGEVQPSTSFAPDAMDLDTYSSGPGENSQETLPLPGVESPQKSKTEKGVKANTSQYGKLLRPILSSSSRLGRALAELFGLLVKLSVGSPIRQRRSNHHLPTIPGFVSPSSCAVAKALAELLIDGLKWEPVSPTPVPRLSFKICAVGFSAPLLLDEKKLPFHLMLKMFCDVDGIKALFQVFNLVLEGHQCQPGIENDENRTPNLSEKEVEFLEAWLALVEKLVNPSSTLETPHVLLTKAPNVPKSVLQFEPNTFLGLMHRMAFDAVMSLWSSRSMSSLGTKGAESMLGIFCHILRHTHQLRADSTPQSGPATTQIILNGPTIQETGSILRSNRTVMAEPWERRRVLTPIFGSPFAPQSSGEAPFVSIADLNTSDPPDVAADSSLDDLPGLEVVPVPTAANDIGSATANISNIFSAPTSVNVEGRTISPRHRTEAEAMNINMTQLQQLVDMGFPVEGAMEALVATHGLLEATEYLLNNGNPAAAEAGSANEAPPRAQATRALAQTVMDWATLGTEGVEASQSVTVQLEDGTSRLQHIPAGFTINDCLCAEDINTATDSILEKCIAITDDLPDTVFKVCELLVVVATRRGKTWMKTALSRIVTEIEELLRQMHQLIADTKQSNLTLEHICNNSCSQRLYIRLHLFALMFDHEAHLNCALLMDEKGIVPLAISEIRYLQEFMAWQAEAQGEETITASTPKWLSPLVLTLDLYQKSATANTRRRKLAMETDHVWKWFDINSGKWCLYSAPNNHTIDTAFWNGENTVRITAGRRRYVISFGGMIQLNEETSNRRPITLWLKSSRDLKGGASNPIPRSKEFQSSETQDPFTSTGTHSDKMDIEFCNISVNEYDTSRFPHVEGLSGDQAAELINCSVTFLRWVPSDTLHSIMRLCLRLTRSFEMASRFSDAGGVRTLLNLTEDTTFAGFLPLANLLIRHAMEDRACLRFAMEKMIRAKALSTGASTCKELHYLLRVLAPVACRETNVFTDVAEDILRVDINFVTRRGLSAEDDMRLIIKPTPCKPENLKAFMSESSKQVVHDLLMALPHHPQNDDGDNENKIEDDMISHVETCPLRRSQRHFPPRRIVLEDDIVNQEGVTEQMDTDSPKQPTEKTVGKNKKYIIPKLAIFQLLAESVHSYSYSSKVIAEFTYQAKKTPNMAEDTTALAYMLDTSLTVTDAGGKDGMKVVMDLISGMAACNHMPEVQTIIVAEIKGALQRAVALRESPAKHARITAISNLLGQMIESCPSSPTTQLIGHAKPLPSMNPILKLVLKKGLMADLTRIPHHLDLTSGELCGTLNSLLSTLEIISRIVNQPVAVNPSRPKPRSEVNPFESMLAQDTSNSAGTRAQGEETVEDADNTEHDISAAEAESLDPTSENHQGLLDGDDAFVDAMANNIFATITNQVNESIRNGENMNDLLRSPNRMDTEQDEANDSSDSDSESEGSVENEEEEQNEEDDEDEDEEDDDDESEEDEEDENFLDAELPPEGLRGLGLAREPLDREEDLLMVQYGDLQDENTPMFFSNNTSYNFNLGLFEDPLSNEGNVSGLRINHPLLSTPIISDQPDNRALTRTRNRARRYQYFQYINPRHPHPPAILQRLLGPSTAQEVMQLTTGQGLPHSLRDTRFVVQVEDPPMQISSLPREGGTRSDSLANFTALHWWCEEARTLDGDSMHDCVVGIKRKIVEAVENERDLVFKVREEKRRKEAEESKKKAKDSDNLGTDLVALARRMPELAMAALAMNSQESGASSVPALFSPEGFGDHDEDNSDSNMSDLPDLEEIPPANTQSQESCANLLAGLRADLDRELAEMDDLLPASLRDELVMTEESFRGALDHRDRNEIRQAIDELFGTPNESIHNELSSMSIQLDDDESSATTNLLRESILEIRGEEPVPTQSVSTADPPEASAANQAVSDDNKVENSEDQDDISTEPMPQPPGEPVAGPSGLQSDDFRNILGDIEVPEGVDPSFLAALPEEMRQEVIAEHLRQQRLRQPPRSQPAVAEAAPAVGMDFDLDVSPEFLAALPPQIQEELLAQQRIERQRRAAVASNPNDPVDTEAFFRNLQPSLRQSILADMEESQIAVLPPELAAEAQNLRREWESRNRQLLQDRFIHGSNAATSATFTSILRNSGMRHMSSRYALQSAVRDRGTTVGRGWRNWGTGPNAAGPSTSNQLSTNASRIKGKQLVDHEALCCILIILYIEDPKINNGRLHRVLRNLSYHAGTRNWIIRALLSVLEKGNECTIPLPSPVPELSVEASKPSVRRSSRNTAMALRQLSSGSSEKKRENAPQMQTVNPSWLNVTLESAMGCRANVFHIQKAVTTGKKSGSEHRQISIHPQAVPSMCKNTMDMLCNLAKSFPCHFLPGKHKSSVEWTNDSAKIMNSDGEGKGRSSSSSSGKGKQADSVDSFFELLLKLDAATTSKKGKSAAKPHSSGSMNQNQQIASTGFEESHFGKLISMLGYPFIRRSSLLTDKLLRILSMISLGIPDTNGYGRKVVLEESSNPDYIQVPESHLRLIVEVITAKSCSEEGLEEATSLLLNLSFGPPATRDKILKLLTEGVRKLGIVVCEHIASLMNELRALNKDGTTKEASEEPSNTEAESLDKKIRGTVLDRFTKESVIITSKTKGKPTSELQLPTMLALTSKSSSQAFFLRLLKVIISLREAIRTAVKKHKDSAVVEGPIMSSTRINGANSGTNEPIAATESSIGRDDQPMDVDQETMDTAESPPVAPTDAASSASDTKVKDKCVGNENMEAKSSINVNQLLPRLSEVLDLDTLWATLSECLLELGHTPDHHAVLVLQPAVEAFFLVHASTVDKDSKKVKVRETREAQLAHLQQDLPPVSPVAPSDANTARENESSSQVATSSQSQQMANLSPDAQSFVKFAETHRTVLNQILRQSTSHLADGPFAVLVDHTRVLDFDVKRRYFRTELERLDEGVRREDLAVHVRRSNVFEDSVRELQRHSAENWKNRFYIVFEGEEGQDAGGLLREWYMIISREIFNPMYALFTVSPGDRVTYMINPSSHCNSNHLFYFKFVGRVIAKAIYDNKLLECYFTRSFYKHILGKHVKHVDMESEDYSFYQGLAYLMENNVSDLGYDLTFSTEVQEFGVTEVRDLIANGRNIAVTEDNKMEYIRLVCQMKMTGAIRKQLNAFLEGFYDIIPKRLISIFSEQELELLVSGLPNIDIEDLKANAEYHKYLPTSLQIQWFWRALRSFDQADRAKFLQFVTGTSKVPLQGFGALEGMNGVQKFQIHRDDRSTDRLPSAHTCFNQLDLPAYETYDKLRSYMLKAIHECSEGFGFA